MTRMRSSPSYPHNRTLLSSEARKRANISFPPIKRNMGRIILIRSFHGKKGKLSDDGLSNNCNGMQPSLDKWYRVADVYLYNVITTVIKECRTAFSQEYLANLRLVCRVFANIVPKVIRWLCIDFSTLRDPRSGYEQQDHMDHH